MKIMKNALLIVLLLTVVVFACGCADRQTPYEKNDAENYSVSVKFDANGGFFTTNTAVIMDSYRLSDLPVGSNGKHQVALIPTDHEARGGDAFAPIYNGYFLAGWYAQRLENGDGTYTYADKWNFDTDVLELDAGAAYNSAEPVLTLYAAWVPMFQVEFMDLKTGESLYVHKFDPSRGMELALPQWSEKTGAIDMEDFPEKDGYTFTAAYYDAQGKEQISGTRLTHPGVVDEATGTAQNGSMQVYVDYREGNWFHIYNVEQFQDNAGLNSSFILHSDLDFSGEIWPTTLMYGKYAGVIEGNGHTISNVTLTQTNNSREFAGLFGRLEETARLKDLNLQNITFTIQSGTRKAGTSYGLLAGAIADGATVSNVTVEQSYLCIDSGCYFGTDDYTIGLVCGSGAADVVEDPGITCQAVGDNPQRVQISQDGNTITVTINQQS